jgi:hypothetical protein
MRSTIIFNYINKITLLWLAALFLSLIIPDVIVLSTHWSSSDRLACYLLLSYYSFILTFIIIRKISIKCCINSLVSAIFITITSMISIILYIIAGSIIIFDNMSNFHNNPVYICIASHTVYFIVMFVAILTYLFTLCIVNINNKYKVVRLLLDVNILNFGFSRKELGEYIHYKYNMGDSKLERFGKIFALDYYEAICIICKETYHDSEDVYLFPCGHHVHSKCGHKVLTNITCCIACKEPVKLVSDYVY